MNIRCKSCKKDVNYLCQNCKQNLIFCSKCKGNAIKHLDNCISLKLSKKLISNDKLNKNTLNKMINFTNENISFNLSNYLTEDKYIFLYNWLDLTEFKLYLLRLNTKKYKNCTNNKSKEQYDVNFVPQESLFTSKMNHFYNIQVYSIRFISKCLKKNILFIESDKQKIFNLLLKRKNDKSVCVLLCLSQSLSFRLTLNYIIGDENKISAVRFRLCKDNKILEEDCNGNLKTFPIFNYNLTCENFLEKLNCFFDETNLNINIIETI